jgi:hypothetical protein
VEFHELVNEESILQEGKITLNIFDGEREVLHTIYGGTIQTECGAINIPYTLPDTLESNVICNNQSPTISLESISGTAQ